MGNASPDCSGGAVRIYELSDAITAIHGPSDAPPCQEDWPRRTASGTCHARTVSRGRAPMTCLAVYYLAGRQLGLRQGIGIGRELGRTCRIATLSEHEGDDRSVVRLAQAAGGIHGHGPGDHVEQRPKPAAGPFRSEGRACLIRNAVTVGAGSAEHLLTTGRLSRREQAGASARRNGRGTASGPCRRG